MYDEIERAWVFYCYEMSDAEKASTHGQLIGDLIVISASLLEQVADLLEQCNMLEERHKSHAKNWESYEDMEREAKDMADEIMGENDDRRDREA